MTQTYSPAMHAQDGPQSIAFKALLKRPTVAWLTVLWFVVTLSVWVASTYAGLHGVLPVWVSVIINAAAVFSFFTVIHDSSHRAICKNGFFNDLLGGISAFFYGPFTIFTLKAFRYIHMQHHLNTNHPQDDPDFWCARGNWFTRGLRWATVDFYYTYYYCKHIKTRPKITRYFPDGIIHHIGFFLLCFSWIWLASGFLLVVTRAHRFIFLVIVLGLFTALTP